MKTLNKDLVKISIVSYVFEKEEFYWEVDNASDFGLYVIGMDGTLPTRRKAINNWKKFAKINGIKNFKITEG